MKAGVMLAGEGLHPSSRGKRVHISGAARSVTDGPFAETKELIAGFWLWQVKSMEEAAEEKLRRRRAGVDPIWDVENLVGAEQHAKGQHGVTNLKDMLSRLRVLDAADATADEFKDLLGPFKNEAAVRR